MNPLSEAQVTRLREAVADLSPSQLAWVSGYLAALSQNPQSATADSAAPVAPARSQQSLTILYGSHTGNGEGLANALQQRAQSAGIACNVVSMGDYKNNRLKDERLLLVIVSTHGEGEPPDDAEQLHAFLDSRRAPKLGDTKYAVLALGDSSYEYFCQTGKDFDQRLAKLGAQALLPRVDCDVDYEEAAEQWQQQVLAALQPLLGETQAAAASASAVAPATAVNTYDKKHPFTASLLANQKITGRNSLKDVRHIEIDLADSGLHYQPGDALGVWFENDPEQVDELLAQVQLDPEQTLVIDGHSLTLREALCRHYELTSGYPGFVQHYAAAVGASALQAIVDDSDALRAYIHERQIFDVVREHPGKLADVEALLGGLRRLTPRLYSIASSQEETPDEVHLTVGLVEYQRDGREHLGGATGYLVKRLDEAAPVRVYVEPNKHFKLPDDPQAPLIMVGPGTGIAPFRSFMQHRDALGSSGKNWLFFGNPHFTEDFLYQSEWQQYVKSGLLSRIDLAFSRDQEQKIYVQDRLREQGAEVYRWLSEGAYFYVCGDANRMAKDVHQALVDIVAEHGQLNAEEAAEYVNELRKAKRYQRDVY